MMKHSIEEKTTKYPELNPLTVFLVYPLFDLTVCKQKKFAYAKLNCLNRTVLIFKLSTYAKLIYLK